MRPYIETLSPSEIHQVHMASMELLEKTGMEVLDDKAIDIFEAAGAIVDRDSKVVKIPVRLVNDALSKCAPSVTLYNSDGTKAIKVGGDEVNYGTVGFANYVLDWKTGVVRDALISDYEDILKLCDVLDYPQFVLPPAQPVDCPIEISDLYQAKVGFLTTKKPLIPQAYDGRSAKAIIEMAAEVVGGMDKLVEKPNMAMLVTCTSPLVIRLDASETVIETAKAGVPLFIESGPMTGATSPVTLCSAVALANAENLAHIVLAKLVNPEVPVIYASWCRLFDMRYGNVSLGCPELALMRVANAQMGKYYKLPCGGGGCLTDANSADVQLGWEKMVTASIPGLGHANMILGMGIIGQENTLSCECLLIDSEIVRISKRLIDGIAVDEERLALDIIKEVGHGGTSFVSKKHTKKFYPTEQMLPRLTDRSVPAEWVKNGAKNFNTVAREMVASYIDKWQAPAIPEGSAEKLQAIIDSNADKVM